jgi:signal peptidase I
MMKMKTVLRSALFTNLILLLGVLAVRWSFAEMVYVPSGSMEPTILPGDRLWVSKWDYGLKFPGTSKTVIEIGVPKRGDVIVFRFPFDPSQYFVKRLIGLPGDHIEVKNGELTINGVRAHLKDAFWKSQNQIVMDENWGGPEHKIHRIPTLFREESIVLDVPKNKYFFMGDNRDNSSDSRVWGFVDESLIVGKARNVVFSLLGLRWPFLRWERSGTVLN